MKKVLFSALIAASLLITGSSEASQYGFVNFKEIVDGTKLGKQEQSTFEALKNQMEKVLSEKEKEFNDLVVKFNDQDYLDSLSDDATAELKNKARDLQMDMNDKQSQFMQALQNAQAKIMSKIAEVISISSKKVAKDKNLDAAFNQDAAFYVSDANDITKDVIKEMDAIFEKEASDKPAPAMTSNPVK